MVNKEIQTGVKTIPVTSLTVIVTQSYAVLRCGKQHVIIIIIIIIIIMVIFKCYFSGELIALS